MKDLCRHIRRDMCLILTPEMLNLRELPETRKFYLPFKHVPQSWWGNFCKSEARKWKTKPTLSYEEYAHAILTGAKTERRLAAKTTVKGLELVRGAKDQ